MLPKRLRLPRTGFSVQKAGKRRISSRFSITTAPAAPKEGGLAVVVSVKVAPKAVDRHRLKRQVLSVLKPYATAQKAVIVHSRAGAAALPFVALQAELLALVTESGLAAR